jgi:hypothetical protein
VTEIRSYRRVFDLERRIYSVDRMRLNPTGVPVRGVVYLLAAVALFVLGAHLPLVGAIVRLLPWFVRDAVAPAALAAVMTVIRIDGRRFHHAARATVSFWSAPRRVGVLCERARTGARWRPEDLLFLPDGSDSQARSLRYVGPGAVVVFMAHRVDACPHSRAGRLGRRRESRLSIGVGERSLRRGRVLELAAGTSLFVVSRRSA